MLDKLTAHLKSHHASVTPVRLAVFRYLSSHDRTSLQALVSYHGSIDQASIYRTIALFKDLGIAQEVISGGRKLIELTDSFDSHHHHISCSNCGLTISVEDPTLERYLMSLARKHGITPQSHQIEVAGQCQDCATNH